MLSGYNQRPNRVNPLSFLYKIFITFPLPLERKETDPLELSATRRYSQPMQYLISIVLVVLVSAVCFLFAGMIGYRVVALIL